jgi:hypothetical protein
MDVELAVPDVWRIPPAYPPSAVELRTVTNPTNSNKAVHISRSHKTGLTTHATPVYDRDVQGQFGSCVRLVTTHVNGGQRAQ